MNAAPADLLYAPVAAADLNTCRGERRNLIWH